MEVGAANPDPIGTDPIVRFAGVQKTYDGDRLAVASLDLTIQKREFITLLGPSGSGKTTTLMMLAGFEAPTSGEIFLSGQPVTRIPPHRRNIGVVFQNYALFPHMTVAENVAFPLSVRRRSKEEIKRRVERTLDLVRLAGYGNRRPAQLSGGQQQRIALARALVFDPDLVLMDEPLGALDRQLREHMQFEIKRLHDDLAVTVVYVTHDQSEALTMSDRIAVFKDGVVQQLATPADLYERPQNTFVAQFVGENNRLRGKVRSLEGDVCAVDVAGALVRAAPVGSPGVGSETILSIRPERIVIDPQEGSCPNCFEATVSEFAYLGDHLRARVAVLGCDDFILKIPNLDGRRPVEVGNSIMIGWRICDCRALDAE
jgi:putative spermidine/putrescine transport system ATP-binding protein